MMTPEQSDEWCCVLAALTAITDDDPNQILAAIAAQAEPGECVIDGKGLMQRAVYTRWLNAQGWKGTWLQDAAEPIPLTCLVITDGHTWAIVNGTIYDNGAYARWGRRVLAFYEPPGGEGKIS